VLAEERRQLDELNQTLEKRVQERSLQVRTLASELTIAEQRERYRIAQILHDHIQQLLYGIDLRITLLAHNLPAEQHDLLGESKEIVQEAIRATRTLAVELSPPVLQGEGLVSAFQWLAHQMKVIHSLQVILDVQEPPEVPPIEIRVLLLQSVRELLFNVVKHADVAVATVTVNQEAGNLVVQVVDQGRGFDLANYSGGPRLPETFGLYSIRERLQLFGGNLKVDSAPGLGTSVVMIVPRIIVPRLS
jgi:signal transduction histidine kinase